MTGGVTQGVYGSELNFTTGQKPVRAVTGVMTQGGRDRSYDSGAVTRGQGLRESVGLCFEGREGGGERESTTRKREKEG